MAQPSSDNNQPNTAAKMYKPKTYDFTHCFRPFYYFSRVLDFMPFSVIFDSKAAIYRPAVRALDVLWFMIAIAVYLSTAIGFYVRLLNISNSAAKILSNADQFIAISSIFFGALIIVMDMCTRFKYTNILNEFNRIDEIVCSFHGLASLQILFFIFLGIKCRWQQLGSITIIKKSTNAFGDCVWWS